MRAFFVGWRIRFVMYMIHASMTVDLMEKLEGMGRSMKNKE
jgi:hypothetical protein